jgi:hypothetical protein
LKRQLSLPVSMDVALVGQAIEQRCGHLGVCEDARPFAESQIRGHDD